MNLSDYAHDHATAELIESSNFKQALRNLEKRLKKSPSDIQATALKASIFRLLGDPSGSYTICSSLISKSPPVTDHHILELIYRNLCELRRLGFDVDERLLDSLWQNAIAAQRNTDTKLSCARKWASQSVRNGQWQQTVKAAMTLQKNLPPNSPQSRNHWFSQIVARYMAGQTASTDQLKTVQLGLVLKILQKAVTDIPENSGSVEQPGLWISTVPELKLLTEIFSRQGKYRELILAIDKIPESIKNDYTFGIDQSRALHNLDDALGRWNNAKTVLNGAEEQHQQWLLDDSRPWTELVDLSTSAFASEIGTDIFAVAKGMAERQANSSSFSRASRQALLNLRWHESIGERTTAKQSKGRADELSGLEICQEHFDKYVDRHFALDDIQDKLETLDIQESLAFSQHAAKIAKERAPDHGSEDTAQIRWIVAEINALRVDFQFLKREIRTTSQTPNTETEKVLRKLISTSLHLYKLSLQSNAKRAPMDSGPGDEACLLAAEALRILSIKFQVPTTELHRACLLSELLANSEHNFAARAQYVGQLVLLGLYSSAFSIYKGLSVKDILHEPMAPLVFTHISTCNAYASDKFDARVHLEQALKFFKDGVFRIPDYQELALESRNYAQVLEMADLAGRLKDSPTRWLLGLERRRISRLRNVPYDAMDLSLDVVKLPSQMNFDHYSPESQKYPIFHLGDIDNYIHYVRYLAFLDLIHEAVSSVSVDSTRSQEILKSLRDQKMGDGLRAFDTMDGEVDAIRMFKTLTSLVLTLSKDSSNPADIIVQSNELLSLTNSLWGDTRISFWSSKLQKKHFPRVSFCRECYTVFELLQNIFKASDTLKTYAQQTQNAAVKAKRQEILNKATDLATSTTASVKAMGELVSKVSSQLPGKLVQELKDAFTQTDDVSTAVGGVVTQERVTKFIALYMQDARSSLEGLLNLKLRATKS